LAHGADVECHGARAVHGRELLQARGAQRPRGSSGRMGLTADGALRTIDEVNPGPASLTEQLTADPIAPRAPRRHDEVKQFAGDSAEMNPASVLLGLQRERRTNCCLEVVLHASPDAPLRMTPSAHATTASARRRASR